MSDIEGKAARVAECGQRASFNDEIRRLNEEVRQIVTKIRSKKEEVKLALAR